jgi:hypothetical protein
MRNMFAEKVIFIGKNIALLINKYNFRGKFLTYFIDFKW